MNAHNESKKRNRLSNSAALDASSTIDKTNLDRPMKTLFVYMPKCAGSSMKEILERKKLTMTFDYGSFCRVPQSRRPQKILKYLISPYQLDPSSFVFGHYYPVKYLGSIKERKPNDIRLITFLRDPIQRLASHYNYWLATNTSKHFLWKRMKKEEWSFTRFALEPEMKNFYSQHLTQVPITAFDFFGIHENIARDWKRLCKFLELDYEELPHSNAMPNQVLESMPQEIIDEIRDFHAEDYMIYNYARHASQAN
jgi:hypothetical protein